MSKAKGRLVTLKHGASLLFSTPSQCFVTGLLVALLGTVGTPGNTQPVRDTTAQHQLAGSITIHRQGTNNTNAIAQQLLGRWQAKDPTSNQSFTFIFAPEGDLFVVLPAKDGSSVAIKAGYQINPTAQPMQLDIQLSPKEQALTIFELTPEGKLRLELDGLTPGQPRPTAFQSSATLFEKTSQATTVPENIQVIELDTPEDSGEQASKSPEDEAKTYMYALTQVQQAHYREVGKFATTIEEVSIGLRTETESYQYRIVPQGDEKQSVMMVAVAKKPELPSYTGAVFVTQVNGETTTVSQICQTAQPSTSPPVMPTAPRGGSAKIQCPAGSRALQ
ncbi:MAG TPA: type IV pilin-like G/H family protein [Cyanophyceae cyanobacterium]